MSNTTNYGWNIPDNTDLVKDGALAIRTLGSAIDTSMNTALGTRKAGMVLLNTTSFSAVASQNMAANLFTATYKNYLLMLNWQQNTTTGSIGLRLRASGVDAATNYFYSIAGFDSNNTANSTGQASQTYFYFSASSPKADSAPNGAYIYVHDPLTAARTMFTGQSAVWQQSDRLTSSNFAGMHSTAAAYDSFSLTPSAGSMTGTISVYGVNV